MCQKCDNNDQKSIKAALLQKLEELKAKDSNCSCEHAEEVEEQEDTCCLDEDTCEDECDEDCDEDCEELDEQLDELIELLENARVSIAQMQDMVEEVEETLDDIKEGIGQTEEDLANAQEIIENLR